MNDLIERQAAIDALKNRWKKTRNYEGNGDDIAEECELYLKQVPSAQPEPKTAHWKTHIFDGIMGGRPRAYMCGYCNFISLARTNYCPNCGAKMEAKNETH